MRYEKLLNDIIKKSKLSQAEIVRKCNDMGVALDKSYLSRLRSGKASSPRPEISKAIAKVCGCNEMLLVIEGFLDEAPKELFDIFLELKFMAVGAVYNLLRQNVSAEEFDKIREKLRNEPIADFVLGLTENPNTSIESSNSNLTIGDGQASLSISKPPTIPISDNSMEPLIPQGSEITLSTSSYEDGKIYFIDLDGTLLVRKVLLFSPNYILIPINSNFETIIKPIDAVKIIGKVNTVIQKVA